MDNTSPDLREHISDIKDIYSHGHQCKHATVGSNILGIILTLCLVSYLVYRYISRSQTLELKAFANDMSVTKMFISLMLLSNIKTLSDSLTRNIVMPIVKPILPLFSCNVRIKFGLFDISVGKFITDLLVFTINLNIIYRLFLLM